MCSLQFTIIWLVQHEGQITNTPIRVQIAKAVDHCDNDKIKTIKYLNKLKGKVCT